MVVAKRPRRAKPAKIEQRKFQGPDEDLRKNKQPSRLAQFTQGRLSGEETNIQKEEVCKD